MNSASTHAHPVWLVGNAAAVMAGNDRVECLRWLREACAELPTEARSKVNRVLAGSGCEQLCNHP